MKKITQYLTIALIAGALALPAFAGNCCKKAEAAAKAGKACGKCVEHACCKEAAAKITKTDKEAKPCAKCTAKKDEKKVS